MVKRKHWIITRFNYGLYKKRTPQAADEWMRKRIPLFERYTVESMFNQTVKNFEWLILIDNATNRKHVLVIEKIVRGLPARIELVDGEKFIGKRYGEHTSVGGELSATIRKIICGESKVSIQTRLDNDDAYAPRTVEILQRRIETLKPRVAIEFKHGYIYDRCADVAYEAEHPNGSPWVSILVNNDTGETVYDGVHQKYRESLQITNYRSWMMVIHGGNVSNKVIDLMHPQPVAVSAAMAEMRIA